MDSLNRAPVIGFEEACAVEGIYIDNFKIFSLFEVIEDVLKAKNCFMITLSNLSVLSLSQQIY